MIEIQSLKRDFKLIRWNRSVIDWRSRTRYFIGRDRNLASISWKTRLNQVTYLETLSILKFRYFCKKSVKLPLSICAYP